MNCEFCELMKSGNREYVLKETKYWTIYLADNQNYPGRCIIPLNRHVKQLSEISNAEIKDLFLIVKVIENVLSKKLHATNFNWTCLMNGAYNSPNPAPHVHFHLIPRYNSAVEFNNEVFCDTQFGDHYTLSDKFQLAKETRQQLMELLKPAINDVYNEFKAES